MTEYFLAGIGGSGMSPLAQTLRSLGHGVRGSDRSRDQGRNADTFEKLAAQGVLLSPQDGSGIDGSVDALVVSSAVEESNPDVQAARRLNVPIRKRAEVLAELFNAGAGLAVGGTSGKSTTAGMAGHILASAGLDPTIVNGGVMLDYADPPLLGNARPGRADLFAIEADESDGSIALYRPAVSVITNISFDHKPLEELRPLFQGFCDRTSRTAILNADCPECAALNVPPEKRKTFSLKDGSADYFAENVDLGAEGVSFVVNGVKVSLRSPGLHNVANALAAIAASSAFGVALEKAADALSSFSGIKRRMQVLGSANGAVVIDDFAHNPDKIQASLAALRARRGRLLAMFQPHGFGPTKLLREGLVKAFVEGLGSDDRLAMPEIYYAGGTADKSISSRDLVDEINAAGRRAQFFEERGPIADWFVEQAGEGDVVVVMGARDDTLTGFAQSVLIRLKEAETRAAAAARP